MPLAWVDIQKPKPPWHYSCSFTELSHPRNSIWINKDELYQHSFFITQIHMQKHIQLTLEWNGFEWHRSTYIVFPINKYMYCKCICIMIFLINFFLCNWFCCKMQYVIHITCKMCVNWLLVLSVQLLVKSRLLVVLSLSSSYARFLTAWWWRWSAPLIPKSRTKDV